MAKRNFIPGLKSPNALLNNGDFNIEIFQPVKIIPRPEDESPQPAGTDAIGFRQMAFEVDDIHAVTETLTYEYKP